MESIGYSIASADALSSFIHSEIERPDNKVRNEKEANESKAAKAKVSGTSIPQAYRMSC